MSSTLKQKSAKGDKYIFDAIHGDLHPVDIHTIPGLYNNNNSWHIEIANRAFQIKRFNESINTKRESLIKNLFSTKENKKVIYSFIDGSLLNKIIKNDALDPLIEKLGKTPKNPIKRLELVQEFNRSGAHLTIEMLRESLLQVLTVFSLGYLSSDGFRIFLITYDRYLKELSRKIIEKRNEIEIKITVDPSDTENIEYFKILVTNNKIVEFLLDNVAKTFKKEIKFESFYLIDLIKNESAALAYRKSIGDKETPHNKNKRKNIVLLEKLSVVMRSFPPFYDLSYGYLKLIFKMYPTYLPAYVLTGRLFLQATKMTIKRKEFGEAECMHLARKYIQSSLEFYGKGKKYLDKDLGPSSMTLLRDYTKVTIFIFEIWKDISIPPVVVIKILQIGLDNLKIMNSKDPKDNSLQRQIESALKKMQPSKAQ